MNDLEKVRQLRREESDEVEDLRAKVAKLSKGLNDMSLSKASAATPHGTLLDQIMDSNQPKNEREWAAKREIEKLQERVTELEKLETALKDGLAGTCIERDSLAAELTALKAQVVRMNDALLRGVLTTLEMFGLSAIDLTAHHAKVYETAAHIPSVREPLSDEQIRKWWASENGLEDADMCKIEDFTKVVRAVEAASTPSAAPLNAPLSPSTASSKPYDMNIHSNPDAMAWAKFFCLTLKEKPGIILDEGYMVSWFANAMMAMHDFVKNTGPINGDHAQHLIDSAMKDKEDDTRI